MKSLFESPGDEGLRVLNGGDLDVVLVKNTLAETLERPGDQDLVFAVHYVRGGRDHRASAKLWLAHLHRRSWQRASVVRVRDLEFVEDKTVEVVGPSRLIAHLDRPVGPGGSVRGERANFTRLVLGCIEAKFCK